MNPAPCADGRALGPIELVVLQGTPFCNLNCAYCYLPVESRQSARSMPYSLVERALSQVLESRFLGPRLTVNWHAGEPLALPIAYYEEAVERIQALRDARGRTDLDLRFHIQTNGVLLDDAWCAFLERQREVFDIGVSCDGPAPLHDRHRRNWAGRPTFLQTVRGMDLLAARGIPYHIIAVVAPNALDHPEEFLAFFRARRDEISGFHFNFVADLDLPSDDPLPTEAEAARYHSFVRRLLGAMRADRDPGTPLRIRNFAQFYAKMFARPELRLGNSGAETSAPFRTLNFDVDGNVTTFHAGLWLDVLRDAYGDGAGFGIGNILQQTLDEIASSDKLRRLVGDFRSSQESCLRDCAYAALCSGGYEIVKRKRFGRFDVSETPECRVHVKAVADALLDDLDEFVQPADAPQAQGAGFPAVGAAP